MLAKLVSGLHKPDDQTVLLPPDASTFVAPLPIRALPGLLLLLLLLWAALLHNIDTP